MADRQYLPLAEPFPAADTPTPYLPWLEVLLLPKPRPVLEGLAGSTLIGLPADLPLLDLPSLVLRPSRLTVGEASTFYGQSDVVAAPDLIAMNLVSPLPRPRAMLESGGGQVPLLSIAFAGDLATTVVAGTLPIAILPSGMTPGVDADG